jgi:hypothetical protein
MQQQVALCNSTAVLGLMEASEILVPSLDVAAMSIMGFAPAEVGGGSRPPGGPAGGPTAVLLAASGRGTPIMELHPVMVGPEWSHARLLQQGSGDGGDGGGARILFGRSHASQARLGRWLERLRPACQLVLFHNLTRPSFAVLFTSGCHFQLTACALCFPIPLQPLGQAAAAMPRDWWQLKQDASLRSFATVLIGPRDAPVGTLSVAREDKHGFDDREW